MIKFIAITFATALALSAVSATACPFEDAKKAAADAKASTSQPAAPAKPMI